jgi:PAS domain S-box-containing protein
MDPAQHQEIARCLFRESNDALFLFDLRTNRVLDANPAALRLTGFDKDAVCTLGLAELFSCDDPRGLERLIEAYRHTGFFHSREGYALRRRQGGPITVNLSVSKIHTVPQPYGLVVARDVSERARAEAALRESEARYRTLVESAGAVIATLSEGGRTIASLNRAFEAITGCSRAEWIGRPVVELVHPDDAAAATEAFARALRGEAAAPLELRVNRRGDGPNAWLELVSLTRFGPEEARGVLIVARDLTERRRYEAALREAEALSRAKEAAEFASRAKTEFLANISHEIRTPMATILGLVELIMEDRRIRTHAPDCVADLEMIRRNGAHLVGILEDLLDLSKIEAGKLPLRLAEIAPAALVAEVAASLRARAAAKDLEFAVVYATAVPEAVRTDPVRVRQVLTNLLGNAIKFTDRGSVRLEVALENGTALRFDVTDTGVGLTESELGRLFEPFYRAGAPAEGERGGTGLGLVISRRLAEMLGGSITVRSRAGTGSTFTLRLPVGPLEAASLVQPASSDGEAQPAAHEPVASERLLGRRILLVEDNAANRHVTDLRLQLLGAEVEAVTNGQEALDRALAASAAGRAFDTVLMDMQMPVLDGYEATRRLRAAGYRGRILALTAYAMPEDREECLAVGCDAHVSKPIAWDYLIPLILS